MEEKMSIEHTVAFETAIALASSEAVTNDLKKWKTSGKIAPHHDERTEQLIVEHTIQRAKIMRRLLETIRREHLRAKNALQQRIVRAMARDALLLDAGLSSQTAERLLHAALI